MFDTTYGEIKINEPILQDLINSPSIERLKKISQAGYFEVYFPNTHHTRFEHSIGVMHLLKSYNAPLEEQAAGLIHDVSHSAFSHCIDYALKEGSEKEHSHQDNVHKEFVRNSEIPGILKKHNFDAEYILNEDNFPLLEKKLPDLCADRIDYSLRSLVHYRDINRQAVSLILDKLKCNTSMWYFETLESGRQFAKLFYHANKKYYSGTESALMFRTVGDVLRYSLEKKLINKNDLYLTDKEVLEKISSHQSDTILSKLLLRMNRKTKVFLNRINYDAKVFCKSRAVDPFVLNSGNLIRLSELDSDWERVVKEESRPKEYYFKFAD